MKTYNRFLGWAGPKGWEEIRGPQGPLATLSTTWEDPEANIEPGHR